MNQELTFPRRKKQIISVVMLSELAIAKNRQLLAVIDQKCVVGQKSKGQAFEIGTHFVRSRPKNSSFASLRGAEMKGFEPLVQLPILRISSATHSTTLAHLRCKDRKDRFG